MKRTLLFLTATAILVWTWTQLPTVTAVAADNVNPDLVSVVRGDLDVRLELVGELRPTRSTTIGSTLAGDKGKIVFLAEDGAAVEAGAELVRLDRAPYDEAAALASETVSLREGQTAVQGHLLAWHESQAKRSVDNARFELELARLELSRFEQGEGPLELARLEAEVSKAESDLAEQSLFVSELSTLLVQGFIQQTEIDQLTARRDDAKRVFDLAEQQASAYSEYIFPTRVAALKVAVERATSALADVQVSAGSKVAEAQASKELAERDLVAARARLSAALADIERTTLRAPLAGMLVLTEEFRNGEHRKPRIGDSVWQGQQLAFLPDLSAMYVETSVREVDVHKLAAGFTAAARIDAYPGLVLDGRVRSLGVLAERLSSELGEKTFSVAVDLVGSDPRLRPGMTARVTIESGSARGVLLVPTHALWEDSGVESVWIATHTGLERRVVRAGLRDQRSVEILQGLAEGERVSLVGPEPSAW